MRVRGWQDVITASRREKQASYSYIFQFEHIAEIELGNALRELLIFVENASCPPETAMKGKGCKEEFVTVILTQSRLDLPPICLWIRRLLMATCRRRCLAAI